MKTERPAAFDRMRLATFVLFSGCIVLGLPIFGSAQGIDAGANAVYNYAGSTPTQSTSFVDASVFPGTGGTDVCAKINAVLATWTHYSANGEVIDARGITNLICSMNPFSGVTKPSVVLLPSGTITTNNTWVLPPNTRLIGVGAPGSVSGTVIRAGSLTGSIIQFIASGSSSAPFSVSAENLTLDGANTAGVSGIVNDFAQEHSYVRNVTFKNFAAPALVVGSAPGNANAQNSGPYEDLYFLGATGGCVVLNAKNTRGIHQMTCASNSGGTPPLPSAGVLLDGPENTIQDTHFEGFQDGILIGSQPGSEAFGDVISNADGNSNPTEGQMTNVVHIENSTVVDLTLTGIRADGFNVTAPNSIQDDEAVTTLSDSTVAVYALGEPAAGFPPGGPIRGSLPALISPVGPSAIPTPRR